jgi:hypothetical protein
MSFRFGMNGDRPLPAVTLETIHAMAVWITEVTHLTWQFYQVSRIAKIAPGQLS